MSTFKVPVTIRKELDSLTRRFWWGAKPDATLFWALKAWSSICILRSKGGLGFRCFKNINLALITKLGWKLQVGIIVCGQPFLKLNICIRSLFSSVSQQRLPLLFGKGFLVLGIFYYEEHAIELEMEKVQGLGRTPGFQEWILVALNCGKGLPVNTGVVLQTYGMKN